MRDDQPSAKQDGELNEQQRKGDASAPGDFGGSVANEYEWRITACSRYC